MAVSASRARDLALSLPTVSETPHWDRLAFRTPRKIFATLDADARDLNFMFDQDLRYFLLRASTRHVSSGARRLGAQRCHTLRS